MRQHNILPSSSPNPSTSDVIATIAFLVILAIIGITDVLVTGSNFYFFVIIWVLITVRNDYFFIVIWVVGIVHAFIFVQVSNGK